MANFVLAGKKNPGDALVADGGLSPVAPTDTLTIHGYTMTVLELIRRGLIRTASVAGNITTFRLVQAGDKVNQ